MKQLKSQAHKNNTTTFTTINAIKFFIINTSLFALLYVNPSTYNLASHPLCYNQQINQ